jgi:amidase
VTSPSVYFHNVGLFLKHLGVSRSSADRRAHVLTTTRTNPVKPGDAEALLAPLGLTISPSESHDFHTLLAALHDCAENVLALPDYQPTPDQTRNPRENVRRCSKEEQAFGQAWAYKFLIRGNPNGGALTGKSVSLKDVIAVAGVPQLLGSDSTPAWTPITDATVVTRVLDAGANIVGTSTCESYCHSTSSYTSAQGVVENPHAVGYSAGGSTSGGAALVAGCLVDITIGGDQGGSIRVPAALCGCKLFSCFPGWMKLRSCRCWRETNAWSSPIYRHIKWRCSG